MTTEKMNELFAKAIKMCEESGYTFPDGFNRIPGLNRRKRLMVFAHVVTTKFMVLNTT